MAEGGQGRQRQGVPNGGDLTAPSAAQANRDLLEARASEVMEKSFPVLDVDAHLDDIKSKLQRHPAILIEDFKRITAIITRSDVLELPH